MTQPTVAIIDGQFTTEGEKIRDEIATATVREALKTDDPRAFVAAWSRLFRAGIAQLAEDRTQ